MRSLTWKLAAAFWLVSLIGIVLVALLAGRAVQNQSEAFESRQAQNFLIGRLQTVYEENGNQWPRRNNAPNNLDRNLDISWVLIGANDNRPILGSRNNNGNNNQRPTRQEIDDASPIIVNGETVGRLVVFNSREAGVIEREVTQARREFLTSVQRSLFVAAGSVTVIALLIGLGFAQSLVRPIRTLTNASNELAQGNLGQEVAIRTNDEIGDLANAFNKMSRDLAESQRLRQQMTADIAHDLRTPLSVIRGHAEALKDGVLPADQETFSIIHDESLRLNRLIEDLRTLSLAEAGELSLVCRPVEPETLIERTILAHFPLADDKGVVLRSELETPLPIVQVDADRISQVLDNLVSNALRYTKAGGRVLIKARQAGDKLWVTVDDNGLGISAEALPHVFDRFYRADGSRQRDGSGSGLGLSIAQSIIEQHNGTISVSSQPNIGTQFTILLPVGASL